MSRDYSEYESSKYDKYLKDRTPENGSVLSVLSNSARVDSDKKTIELFVDSSEEFHRAYRRFSDLGDGFEQYLNNHNETISRIKNILSDDIDYKEVFEKRQKMNAASGNIIFDFITKERMRRTYYFGIEEPVYQRTINIFCNSAVRMDLAEGLLDFLYADFETPLNYLLGIYEQISDDEVFLTESHKVYTKLQKNSELLLDYDKTVSLIKPLLYASIYSAVCPPRFDFDNNFIEQLKWYGNYLINLQKEYLEKIQFCFDQDYYPELFLCADPISRFTLYTKIKGYANWFERTEEMYLAYKLDTDGTIIYKSNDFMRASKGYRELDVNNYDFLKGSNLTIRDVFRTLSGAYDYRETYTFGKVDEVLELEFAKMLKSDIKLKKCKRCGKYFRVKGKYPTECCSRIAEGEGRLCREIASSEKYKIKNADNQALKIYNKYYKRYMARVKVNQLKEDKFIEWQFDALAFKYDCERGIISLEDYIEFNEAYFPNRKKKENK